MSMTSKGSKKVKAKMIEKYGEKGYRNKMAVWGSKGGSAKGKPKGFAALTPERRKEIWEKSYATRMKKKEQKDV